MDGAKANFISTGGYQFPMAATWLAPNPGGVITSANYFLGNYQGGAADQYGADTSPMTVPADYTTLEVTDASSSRVVSSSACTPGNYLLNGYRVSVISFADAAAKTISTIPPSFTGLMSDAYIVVDNSKCPTTGSISGMKYNDLNRNGKKDVGETGLSGWTIRLVFGGTIIATTTTDADGNYSFQNITPGTYKVRETHQKGWKRISKNSKKFLVAAGSVFSNVNFGNAIKKSGEPDDSDNDDNRDE